MDPGTGGPHHAAGRPGPAAHHGPGFWLWLTPVVFLGLIPLLDLVAGYDDTNPPDEVIEALENDKYYRWVTYLYLPVQYTGFVLAMWYLAAADLSVIDKVGLALSAGTVAGVAINTAHELGHKREANERWLSKVALAQSFYGHFYIEHNRGHHVRVATPEDPASARMGESVYRFWPRAVWNSLKSAWGLEKKRYARKGTHPFHLGNDVLNAWLMSVVLWGRADRLARRRDPALPGDPGTDGLHPARDRQLHGALRDAAPEGGHAGQAALRASHPAHSWNSNNVATNVLLYHLQRHSDHHANPTRRYQTLRDFREAPVLPTGYTGMIVALFPPLFRKLMDKRVVAHYDGDLRLANLHPAKREELLRKYPPPVEHDTRDLSDDPGVQTVTDDVVAARCPGCSYTYEVAAGNEAEGFAAGTPWSEIPAGWCCPDCGVREKVDFVPLTTVEVR